MAVISTAASPLRPALALGQPRRWLVDAAIVLPGPLAVALWVVALRGADPGQMDDLGLVSILPPLAFVALGVLTAGFSLAAWRRETPEALLFGYVLTLIALLHGTPAVLYGTLRYSWSWKHVGVVDYIQRHGSVNPDVGWLSAYHNWPGFFAYNAMIVEVAGVGSAAGYASWAPVFFNVLFILGLQFVFRTLTPDRRLVWQAVWIFEASNWVGQDYFSPQAVSYFLFLVAVGIGIRWFGVQEPPALLFVERWLRRAVVVLLRTPGWVLGASAPAGWLGAGQRTAYPAVVTGTASLPAPVESSAWQRVLLMLIAILAGASIAVTHQLTPMIAIISLALLVVARRCTARWLPVLVAVCTVAWIVYMAVGFLKGNLYWIVDSVGLFSNNVRSTFIDLSNVSRGQWIVAIVDRILSATVGGLAALGCARRLRAGFWDVECLLLAAAPIPILVGNSYGGEIMFRVYFFALPFMAFFAASLFYPRLAAGRGWLTPVAAAIVSAALLAGLLVGYYGKERAYYFTPNEIDAAEYLYAQAPPGALWVSATTIWPMQYRNYELYDYHLLDATIEKRPGALTADPVGTLVEIMDKPRYPASYLIITRSQKAAYEMIGLLPPGSLDRLPETLLASGRFEQVFANPDATILQLSVRENR